MDRRASLVRRKGKKRNNKRAKEKDEANRIQDKRGEREKEKKEKKEKRRREERKKNERTERKREREPEKRKDDHGTRRDVPHIWFCINPFLSLLFCRRPSTEHTYSSSSYSCHYYQYHRGSILSPQSFFLLSFFSSFGPPPRTHGDQK